MKRSALIAATAVSLCASTLAFQQPAIPPASKPEIQRTLQQKFEELHKAGSFPGGTAGFVLGDGSSLALAVGVSD
ncbi:MAG TPA: hypothetical protein VM791_16955, partial [Vicinamibacterales bacterium]|nr:hypothetical protein [Vicinamibacterales bacterium]